MHKVQSPEKMEKVVYNGNWVQHDCKGCTGCGLGTV